MSQRRRSRRPAQYRQVTHRKPRSAAGTRFPSGTTTHRDEAGPTRSESALHSTAATCSSLSVKIIDGAAGHPHRRHWRSHAHTGQDALSTRKHSGSQTGIQPSLPDTVSPCHTQLPKRNFQLRSHPATDRAPAGMNRPEWAYLVLASCARDRLGHRVGVRNVSRRAESREATYGDWSRTPTASLRRGSVELVQYSATSASACRRSRMGTRAGEPRSQPGL